MPMRKAKRTGLATLLVLMISTAAGARPVSPETFDTLTQQPDALVVGQVTKIEKVRAEKSAQWGMEVQINRATFAVLRGIKVADGSPFDAKELSVEYPAYPDILSMFPPNGPVFVGFQAGQVSLLPVKRDAAGVYRFLREENFGMIMPASREPPIIGPDRLPHPNRAVDFLQDEMTAVFVKGDYPLFIDMGRFLSQLGTGKEDEFAEVLRRMRGLITDEKRWAEIALAVYAHSGWSDKPPIEELKRAMREMKDMRVVVTALQRITPPLNEKLIPLMFAHQAEGSLIASAIAKSYPDDPLTIVLERKALIEDAPSSMMLATLLVKDDKHPLAEPALALARKTVTGLEAQTLGGKPHEASVYLLLRAGSPQDFSYFLEQLRIARDRDSRVADILFADCDSGPPSRVLEAARVLIDSTAPSVQGGDRRLCDSVGFALQGIAKIDFGLRADQPVAQRDVALAKVRAWLRAN